MIDKNLANELVAVGGWIAVMGAFLAAIGSTGQVEPDPAITADQPDDLEKQLSAQKKQLRKQQIQLQLLQLQQELDQVGRQLLREKR